MQRAAAAASLPGHPPAWGIVAAGAADATATPAPLPEPSPSTSVDQALHALGVVLPPLPLPGLSAQFDIDAFLAAHSKSAELVGVFHDTQARSKMEGGVGWGGWGGEHW